MKNKNKNNLIHELKEFVKANGKTYNFPTNTEMVLDRYDDYLNTKLNRLVLIKDKLVLCTTTAEFGDEEDNLSEFHSDIVNDVYNIVMNN